MSEESNAKKAFEKILNDPDGQQALQSIDQGLSSVFGKLGELFERLGPPDSQETDNKAPKGLAVSSQDKPNLDFVNTALESKEVKREDTESER